MGSKGWVTGRGGLTDLKDLGRMRYRYFSHFVGCLWRCMLVSLIINQALGWPGVMGAFLPRSMIRFDYLLSCLLGRKARACMKQGYPFSGKSRKEFGQ